MCAQVELIEGDVCSNGHVHPCRSLDKVDGVTGIRIERTGSFRLSKRRLADPVEEFRANNRTEGDWACKHS